MFPTIYKNQNEILYYEAKFKKEIKTINDASTKDRELLGDMLLAASNIAKENNIDKDGYRLVINCNRNAGQTVFHLHMHILGGRKLSWPPG